MRRRPARSPYLRRSRLAHARALLRLAEALGRLAALAQHLQHVLGRLGAQRLGHLGLLDLISPPADCRARGPLGRLAPADVLRGIGCGVLGTGLLLGRAIGEGLPAVLRGLLIARLGVALA